ncbi:MAG: glycosyltransferase [Deltaproteobacteria bacterium]
MFDTFHVMFALSVFVCTAYALFILFTVIGTRSVVRTDSPVRAPMPPDDSPGVSIMKPCAGNDDDLESCLESYCALRYPNMQLVFGVRDTSDAAYPIIERVKSRHPELDIAVALSGEGRHPSPKVVNLAAMAPLARHELYWLSDSNTLVSPDTLGGMRAALERPGVGMVVSPIAGIGEATAGSALDNLEVNSWIGFGAIAIHDRTGLVGGPGKSVLIHRDTLARAGGWRELGGYFGEDTVLMSAVLGLGMRLALGPDVVLHPNENASMEAFASRHLRWLLIRLRLYPMSIVGEMLMSPWLLSAAAGGYLASHGLWGRGAAIVLFGALVQCAGDLYTSSRLRGAPVPWRFAPLVWVRPLAIGIIALRAVVRSDVQWRGNAAWVGQGSAILLERPLGVSARFSRWLRAVRPTTPMPDSSADELLERETAPRTSASAARS